MHLAHDMFQQKLLTLYNITSTDFQARADISDMFHIKSDSNLNTSNTIIHNGKHHCSNMNRSDTSFGADAHSCPDTNGSDFVFDEATKAVLETGNLTPLLKEELKYKIQARRMAEGKQELKVEFNPPKEAKLTPEEEIKVQNRKEQNRLAAQKFRQKQKDSTFILKKKIQNLESHNTCLRSELKRLQNEKIELQTRLQQHIAVCPRLGIIT